MKTTLAALAFFISTIVIIYLAFSFTQVSFDISQWTQKARDICVGLSLGIGFSGVAGILISDALDNLLKSKQ